MLYRYDGSFDSFVNAVELALSRHEDPDDITDDPDRRNLFTEELNVGSNREKSEVFTGKITGYATELYTALCMGYLSELPKFEITVFRYFRAVQKNGKSIISNISHPDIFAMQSLVQKVMKEVDRMRGLIRFSELADGLWYAQYEPDHNITSLVAPHFFDRLPNNWIIHDISRGIAAVRKQKKWEIFNIDLSSDIEFSKQEEEYRSIWRRYFKEIAIPERKNLRCQKHFLPRRYWKNLTELRSD